MSIKRRKICVVINNRANYARIKYFLKAAKKIKNLDVNIILGASANLERYGRLSEIIEKDGFKLKYKRFFHQIDFKHSFTYITYLSPSSRREIINL